MRTLLVAGVCVLLALLSGCGEPQEVCVLETSMGTMVFRFFDDDAPPRVDKHMIDDPPSGRTRAPGNRGRKWPPFQRGF